MSSRHIDDDRDKLEMDLIRAALAADLPILAIFRGFQLLNIVYNGKLLQDIGTRCRQVMFARIVELTAKFRKARELAQTINHKILPILQRQPGFVDAIVLVSDIESDHILVLSFWKSQQDADRYNREQYPKVNEIISHLVDRAPLIKTFNVDTYVRHKIASKAA